MTKYIITYLQSSPYYKVEADTIEEAEELAEAQAILEGYNLNEFVDMEFEIEDEEEAI